MKQFGQPRLWIFNKNPLGFLLWVLANPAYITGLFFVVFFLCMSLYQKLAENVRVGIVHSVSRRPPVPVWDKSGVGSNHNSSNVVRVLTIRPYGRIFHS